MDGAIVRLQQVTLQAVLALHRNLSCGKPSVEVSAASKVLDLVVRTLEMDDLRSQIEELVEWHESTKHPPKFGTTG